MTKMNHLISSYTFGALFALVLCSSQQTYACGGFFCNAQTPINQAAERILFAIQGDQIEMHVQIQYQGPPAQFGWILPVTPGVTTDLSSEALFGALDRLYNPVFSLNYDYGSNCIIDEERWAGTAAGDDFGNYEPMPEPEPTVQVISREPVGPYDRAILLAEEVSALRNWLNENEFSIPSSIDDKLQPYIDAGAVFVVIKLLADRDVGDLVPLRLTFPGNQPTIPIIPTSVSAEPDMGMIVHVLGRHRAIPLNYQHVHINEAAIDWELSGRNYSDVVSQAVDETGGRAFVTDYAGEVGDQITNIIKPYSGDVIAEIAAATTFGEIQSAIPDRTNPDYQRIFTDIFGDIDQSWDAPADGLQLSTRLMNELNPMYEQLNQLLFSAGKMTRLYTTMSAHEMTLDPSFAFNPDLEDVDRFHTATLHIICDDEGGGETARELELSDGRIISSDDQTPISRQDGETVRGIDVPAAALIERLSVAGPPEIISQPNLNNPNSGNNSGNTTEGASTSSSNSSNSEDDSCQQLGTLPLSINILILLLLISLSGWSFRRENF